MTTLSDVIKSSPRPATRASIAAALSALGLAPGSIVLVHSSLSRIGYVVGESVAVVQALLDVLGEHGTLVMPSFSDALGDPSRWNDPPLPVEWWDDMRDEMPAYEPAITPVWRMIGAIPELFRRWPGTQRSDHPHASFCARGPHAEHLLADHRLGCAFGERSPLARLYEQDAQVLLLGVGFARCTAFHLAEVHAGVVARESVGAPVLIDGQRRWIAAEDFSYDTRDFEDLGAAFVAADGTAAGTVGRATCHLFSLRRAVDFAAAHLRRMRAP